MRRRVLPVGHPDMAQTLTNLGLMLKDYGSAETLRSNAAAKPWNFGEPGWQPDHYRIGQAMLNLAIALRESATDTPPRSVCFSRRWRLTQHLGAIIRRWRSHTPRWARSGWIPVRPQTPGRDGFPLAFAGHSASQRCRNRIHILPGAWSGWAGRWLHSVATGEALPVLREAVGFGGPYCRKTIRCGPGRERVANCRADVFLGEAHVALQTTTSIYHGSARQWYASARCV